MNLRGGVGIVAIAAMAVACKKSPEGGTGSTSASGSGAVASGSGSAAVLNAAGSGSAIAASDSGSRGSAVGSGSAGSAVAGSAAGSGTGSGTATSGGDGVVTYDKAAFLADPLCMQVADEIRECASKREFIAALDDGATAQQEQINARLRKGVKKWPSPYELCHNAWDILNYEYTGFLDNPAVFKAPNALSSCAELGAAIKAGGGLVGATPRSEGGPLARIIRRAAAAAA